MLNHDAAVDEVLWVDGRPDGNAHAQHLAVSGAAHVGVVRLALRTRVGGVAGWGGTERLCSSCNRQQSELERGQQTTNGTTGTLARLATA